MYNTNTPTRAELPTSRQLIRSTLLALAAAIAILFTVVLPAEYGIDPTGVGRMIGLAEMGEIKAQLAEEAEADRLKEQRRRQQQDANQDSRLGSGVTLAALFTRPAAAHEYYEYHSHPVEVTGEGPKRNNEVVVTIPAREGVEVKLLMDEGDQVDFSWSVDNGAVNYDLHGASDDHNIDYVNDRGASEHHGVLEAAFDGYHGWWWANRSAEDVTVTLRVNGAYQEVVRYE